MLYVALRWGGRGGEVDQACDAVNVQRDAFIWVSRPAVRVMEVGGVSFEPPW